MPENIDNQDPLMELPDNESYPEKPKKNRFKKLLSRLFIILLLAGLGIGIGYYFPGKKKKKPEGKKISKAKPLFELSSKDAKKIIYKITKEGLWKERSWLYFILGRLEKSSLNKGISPEFIKLMQKLYLELEIPGRWLVFCEQLDKKWFQAEGPKPREGLFYNQEERLLRKGDINLLFSQKSKIWNTKYAALFCTESLFHSGNWRAFLYYNYLLSQKKDYKDQIPANWFFFKLFSLNKKRQYQITANLCRKRSLTVKKRAELLEECAKSFTATKQFDSARKAYALAYDISKERKYLVEYSRVLIKEGKKEKAARMLLSIPK